MTSLSINQKKLIRSLDRKKNRQETGLFLVEGDKMVREVLDPSVGGISYQVESVVGTRDWLASFGGIIPGGTEQYEVGAAELKQLSTLREPNGAIAIVKQIEYRPDFGQIRGSLTLGLESIQDPGNLGTILRIADWFGIRDVFCSGDSVELYNPKVIQSTMGSFLRVRVHYIELPYVITQLQEGDKEAEYFPVFATGSQGVNLYEASLPKLGMILMGNESKGLSETVTEKADQTLSIPFQDPDMHPDSLNIATATAVLCSEFRRQAVE
jgi:TrmH family RNA methyltransferase